MQKHMFAITFFKMCGRCSQEGIVVGDSTGSLVRLHIVVSDSADSLVRHGVFAI